MAWISYILLSALKVPIHCKLGQKLSANGCSFLNALPMVSTKNSLQHFSVCMQPYFYLVWAAKRCIQTLTYDVVNMAKHEADKICVFLSNLSRVQHQNHIYCIFTQNELIIKNSRVGCPLSIAIAMVKYNSSIIDYESCQNHISSCSTFDFCHNHVS